VRLTRFAVFSIALWVSALQAAEPPAIRVTAVRLDGQILAGSVATVSADMVRFASVEGRAGSLDVPTSELLSLEFPGAKATPPAAAVLDFANGDRLVAEVGVAEQDALAVRFGGAAMRVPLETLRGIAFRQLDPDDGSTALIWRDRGEDDLVLLTNGDRLAGEFLGLTESDLTLDTAGRESRVPRDRVAAVAFSPDLVSPATIEGARQIVRSPAGWLTVRGLARAVDGSWRAETAFGEPVAWPADVVSRVLLAGSRIEFLSERRPKEFAFVPYLDRSWPLRTDRAVTGEPLSAGGTLYAKGLGVHSRSRVTYDLGGRYESFRAVVGLAASAGEIGSAEFAVEVDGREAFRSGPVTATDAKQIVVDLRGVQTLVLTADFGQNGDVRDRADWCNAVLVRKK
jgi:hypothetical protein